MTIKKFDINTLVLCTVKHALGCSSYVVPETCRIVKEYASDLDSQVIKTIVGLIVEKIKLNEIKDHRSKLEWEDLLMHFGEDVPQELEPVVYPYPNQPFTSEEVRIVMEENKKIKNAIEEIKIVIKNI